MDTINTLLELSKICRLCLSRDQSLFKIFSEDEEIVNLETSVSSKILACVSIVLYTLLIIYIIPVLKVFRCTVHPPVVLYTTVELGDNLPDQICIRCLEQIENWERFKALCDNTNSLLLQYGAGISPLPDEVLQNNLEKYKGKILDIPSTPSYCSFLDVSLLDHDSLLEKIDDTENDYLSNNESVISNPFSTILNNNSENATNQAIKQVDIINENEEDAIKEANKIKWREKYAKSYRKKYNCGLCDNVFTKYSKLLEHDRVEHKELAREYVCIVCHQLFISDYRLEVHTDMKHKEKVHHCDICDFSSVTKKLLQVHKLKHCDRFKCKVCGVTKSTSRSLEDHMHVHSDKKSFQCGVCQRSYKQQQNLDNHMKTHNPHSQPEFKCNICSKIVRSRNLLKIHQTTHNTENSAICEICGKTFKNKNTLDVHKLNHKEKKHMCMFCDKMFTTKALLTRHLQTHKPGDILCSICGKLFNRKDTLKKHMKLHNYYDCFGTNLDNLKTHIDSGLYKISD